MQDKTVIAIAHRLSTIAAMDRLVVLDGAGSSSKARMRAGGQARPLCAAVARQSGGFLDPDGAS